MKKCSFKHLFLQQKLTIMPGKPNCTLNILTICFGAHALCIPEEVHYTLKVSRDEHNEGDDGGEDESWRWSEASHMSHGQDIRLKARIFEKDFSSSIL